MRKTKSALIGKKRKKNALKKGLPFTEILWVSKQQRARKEGMDSQVL